MEYWNDELTEKSWKVLLQLKKEPFKFVLIGGWAAYLWTKLHKSKDIDIVISNIKEIEYLKQNHSLKKNDNLKKYEIQFEEIDVDIYVPYYSKLSIPPEEIVKYTTKIEGIEVVIPEALLILKQGAELDRRASVKGSKDQIDILGLLCYSNIDLKKYLEILKKHKLENYIIELKKIVANFKDIEYLNLNPRQFKLKKKEILENMRKINNARL